MNRRAAQSRARKLLDPLLRRLRTFARRGRVTLVDDGKPIQELQVVLFTGEVRRARRFQEAGFTSVPKADARAICLELGASAEHLVAVAVDDGAFRPQGLAPGEVALYELVANGSTVRLMANGEVHITPRTGKVVIAGDLEVSGDVQDAAGTMDEMRTIYNAHVHPENGGAGPTGPPTTPMT